MPCKRLVLLVFVLFEDVASKTTVGVIHSWVEADDPIKSCREHSVVANI